MKNKKIAVFANGWSGEFLKYVLEGIRKEAAKDGVDIFVYMTYIFFMDDPLQSKCQLNIFHLPNPKDYDGAIMLTNTFNLSDEQERIRALFQRAGVPMISTEVKVPGMAYMGTGNYQGVYELAEHLITVHNVKNVVYLSGIKGNEECAIRKRALCDALKAHGLTLTDTLQGDFGFYTGYILTKQWVQSGKEIPDAFVCANDHSAIGVSAALYEMGIKVPEQVIVTGFDRITEAISSFPMIASVTRRWDKFGENVYHELCKQMENLNPEFELVTDSEFVPAESCGCKPSEEAIHARYEIVRNAYSSRIYSERLDIFFQSMRLELAKVESKEEFHEVATKLFGANDFLGDDFAICVEPAFFELDDESYPQRIRGYSNVMDVLYEKRAGKAMPLRQFHTKEIIPNYHKAPNDSNIYFLVPLNNLQYIIGYVVVKNDAGMIYDQTFRNWIMNMNTTFINVRQYIFAQESNRKLKEIYMMDFLSNMYNRTGCEKVIFQHVEDEKAEGRSVLLLFADINCMKKINDEHGHLMGDLAIKITADAMRKSLPDGWLLGRYGGDEFVAVGPCLDEETTIAQKNALDVSMKRYIEKLSLSFPLSASVGFSVARPDEEKSIEEYISEADESMYDEKQKAHQQMGFSE